VGHDTPVRKLRLQTLVAAQRAHRSAGRGRVLMAGRAAGGEGGKLLRERGHATARHNLADRAWVST